MDKMQLMTGVDIPIPELQVALHQPSIIEISYMGEQKYFSALSTVCFNKDIILAQNQQSQGISDLALMNNFQIFGNDIKCKCYELLQFTQNTYKYPQYFLLYCYF